MDRTIELPAEQPHPDEKFWAKGIYRNDRLVSAVIMYENKPYEEIRDPEFAAILIDGMTNARTPEERDIFMTTFRNAIMSGIALARYSDDTPTYWGWQLFWFAGVPSLLVLVHFLMTWLTGTRL